MELRDRIIKETATLFTTYGIKAVRMDDIATRLGISKRTIYEIFGDKENLIFECIKYYHQEKEQRAKELTASARNIIEEFILTIDRWDEEGDENYKIMSSIKMFYPRVYERLMKLYYKEGYTQLHKKLQKGVEEGYLISHVNLNLAISIFTYSIYGIIKEESTLPHNVSEREAFKYVTTFFFRGIATEKGIKMIDEHLNKEYKTENLI